MNKYRVYWSDREGTLPPPDCTFHLFPFSSKEGISPLTIQQALSCPCRIKVLKKTYWPSQEQWRRSVTKALQWIHEGKLQKVVLARSCRLELEKAPDPFSITAALKEKAEGAFVFCFQSGTQAFLGATPERLFVRKGRRITSEAIAGTRKRGETPAEDHCLQEVLLKSQKDLQELTPVQTYLQHTLSPLCTRPLSFSPISVHQTNNVQHLYSQCIGELKVPVTDEEIVKTLHPTPALCGMPKQTAYTLIHEEEPFERGLYGGALGWRSTDAAEYIVGIRSCLVQGSTATLFSGAGIVKDSNAEDEWDELNQKIRLYEGILDH
ncbi:MAG: hypothetical protein A3D96_03965 [Chlamydiae bacterium RIFCSPHIGHO2_12_FULL_44_59]|nr:MAG: hypothetical protein A2796_02650 [Chlamydiae bacterium RIFCSPHIGHO2_01_FULL_44_39]OGN59915.1 MAG: hypothetical protein A3D96_03965 [Chlamydiae bacterium RIFCSPHIGHO2_12_FULL_44_59]OGN66122.1 MAG: hypothetical protein A2978_04480 [Chlamydiae bacterium RIFCSPLOWO2_01_FULL_44_52]OGN68657.1 MAG: hypothetical protein A3I67_02805 [Chlamydiae bacterium RIFCSPLOWO2_02_FULL_45_22]OGN69770.1 MAG: hypothetical protein A3F79_01680 [Chlamydiae bacterium RIFCSPLOWO2_12_FULL_45_20]